METTQIGVPLTGRRASVRRRRSIGWSDREHLWRELVRRGRRARTFRRAKPERRDARRAGGLVSRHEALAEGLGCDGRKLVRRYGEEWR